MSTDPEVLAADDSIWVFPQMSHHMKGGGYFPHELVKSKPYDGSDYNGNNGDTKNSPDQNPLRRTLTEPEELPLGQESWYSIEFKDYRNHKQQDMGQYQPCRGTGCQSSPVNPTRGDNSLEASHHDSDLLSYTHTDELLEDNVLHFVLSDSTTSEFCKPLSPLIIPEPISITDIYHELWNNSSDNERRESGKSLFQRYKVHIILGLSITAVAVFSFKWILSLGFSSNNCRTTSLGMRNSNWPQSTRLLAKLQSSLRVLSQRLMLYCSTLLNNSTESRKDLRLSFSSVRENVACVLQDVLKLGNLFISL